MKYAFAQVHMYLAVLRKMEEWALIHGDLKTLNYTIWVIQEDLGLLNKKNNHCQEEINNASSEWKMLFEIVGCLGNCINKLETIINTQKHNIARLKRNVATLVVTLVPPMFD